MMPSHTLFTTEIKHNIEQKHFAFLRMLYTPIIGSKAVTLYALLHDYNIINKDNRAYHDFAELSKIMDCSQNDVLMARKKLEAVGLLRVFEKADNKHIIISINLPLSPAEFKNNSLLFKESVAKTGELVFERVYFSDKKKELAKDEFKDVTTKYQDLFQFKKEKTIETTQTIALLSSKTVEDALSALNPEQFVCYLTKKRISPSQLGMIQKLMNFGYSPKTINTLVKYSYDRNNKLIVSNHVLVIAKDLYKKNIVLFPEVKAEIEKALVATKNVAPKTSVKEEKEDSGESWDDIFSSMGGF